MRATALTALLAASAAAVGAAVTLAVWSAALAVFSAHTGARSVAYDAWAKEISSTPPHIDRGTWWALSPAGVAWRVGAVGAVLLGALVVAWVLRERRWWWLWLVVPSAAAAWYLYAAGDKMADFLYVMQQYPVTPRLPTAVAAWQLAAAAAIAAAVGAFALQRLSGRWWIATAVGAIAATVCATTVTTHALDAGKDDRFVDASTAGAKPVPAYPSVLGQRRFTIRVSSYTNTEPDRFMAIPGWSVGAAGPGFVTYGDGVITAYGPDGAERWHYRRNGPGGLTVSQIGLFDNGDSVVADFGIMLAGFDATTGRQLWASTDPALHHAYDGGINLPPGPFLIQDNTDTHKWTRFDTRTGGVAWTIPDPFTGCPHGGQPGNVRLPAAAFTCVDGDHTDVWLAVIDPGTGATQWKKPVLQDVPSQNGNSVFAGAQQAGHGDRYLVDADSSGVFRKTMLVDLQTDQIRPFDNANDAVLTTLDDSGDFLASLPSGYGLYGSSGHLRCALPGSPARRRFDSTVYAAILGDQVLYVTTDDAHAISHLETFNRTDCHPAGAAIATPNTTMSLLSVPGAVLVVRTDNTGTYVDGYRP